MAQKERIFYTSKHKYCYEMVVQGKLPGALVACLINGFVEVYGKEAEELSRASALPIREYPDRMEPFNKVCSFHETLMLDIIDRIEACAESPRYTHVVVICDVASAVQQQAIIKNN